MIFPEDASQNLAASLETVVFPPPDGPTSAVTSPCFAVNETSSRIVSLVSYANLKSPFEDGCVSSIISDIKGWLDAVEDQKL